MKRYLLKLLAVASLYLIGLFFALWCGFALGRLDASGEAGPYDYAFWLLPLLGTAVCLAARILIRGHGHLSSFIDPLKSTNGATAPVADWARTLKILGDEEGKLISEGKLDEAEALTLAARQVSGKAKASCVPS